MRYLALLVGLLFCGCGIFQNTINPVPTPAPNILSIHKAIVQMQKKNAANLTLEMPKPIFSLSWHDANSLSAGITEYRIYRGVGTNTSQAAQQIGIVPYPDTTFIDSTVATNTRYVYRISCYAGDMMIESAKSNPVTATWVNLGPLVPARDIITMYDSMYTEKDMLVATVPSFHPYILNWIKTPVEKVTWKGEFDVDNDCQVTISDLSYYAQQVYNKSACDSMIVVR
jgi:hypothetical protein